MNQTMTHDVEKLITQQIAEGNYRNFDEALTALKSIITDQRILDKVRTAWLQKEVAKGDESGEEIPAQEVFNDARTRIKGISQE